MIRNIIFDYGSVLIKTDCRRVYAPFFGSWEKADWFRTNIVEPEWIHRLDLGEDYATCVADQQRKYPDYAEAIALYDSRFIDFLVGEMPGMRRLLKRLRAYDYHLFGLSNFSHKIYDIEQKMMIFRCLEGQIISSDIHITKPDPRIFKLLMAKYGLQPEECVFVDDREVNTEAAKSLGFSTIVFPEVPFSREQILKGFSTDDEESVPPAITSFANELKRQLELA